MQCPCASGSCGGCRGCGGLLGLSCLLLGLSSAWGLCGASCCVSSEMSHVIPRHVFQTLKSHRWNCNVLGRCTKFGYPNYVRVLVDEAPKANSCVRSSSHDTVHNPPDASNTTPTPHNAKSPLISAAVGASPCGRDSISRAPDHLSPAAPAPREAAQAPGRGGA